MGAHRSSSCSTWSGSGGGGTSCGKTSPSIGGSRLGFGSCEIGQSPF
eukprot:SAG11_NODE_5349_length_1587_cov_1.226326_1_plen_46_part_10